MRPPAAAHVEFAPLFDWSPPRRRKLSIVSFIVASTVLHALCFYLFQIIYPPTVALLPPPARVHIITGNSDDGRVFLRWIEAEDPALSSTTQGPPDAPPLRPPTATHVPSYANWQPALRELPPLQPDLSIPSAQPPGPVARSRRTQPTTPPETTSTLRFGSETAVLGAATLPPLQFSASSREVPQSAEFRVAISVDGSVRHSFLERSSGDPALDEQAGRTLALCRFSRPEIVASQSRDVLVWTTATFEWGNDVVSLPDKPATPSKP